MNPISTIKNNSITDQVNILMENSEFGDEELKRFMTDELSKRLLLSQQTGSPLHVYCGYDATGPDLHLGHTVTMRKLRQFQDFGHRVTFLVGTFTALIGDASDRQTARNLRPADVVFRDAQLFSEQAFHILDKEKTSVRYNHEWLGGLSFKDLFEISCQFTLGQSVARENFKLRFERGEDIGLREILYPLAQGYDAVALQSDVQLGATEQLFNLMAGRKMQEYFGQKPQVCLTFPILVGTDGVKRMSKSTGNYIGIHENPLDKYRKVIQLPTSVLPSYINLLTRWPLARREKILNDLKTKMTDPLVIRHELAWEIVAGLDGDLAANEAAAQFRYKPQGI
jgi:tyrosyl-tRNA synthetase